MTLGTSGNFSFQGGKIITGANYLILTNRAVSSISGHAATMFVQGNLRRNINATGSYDFPVGHVTQGYQLANVNFTSATTINDLTANYQTYGSLPAALGSTECTATYNQNALDNGFWEIDANGAQNNSGVYTMTLYNTNYTNAASGWTVMSRHNGSATWALLNGDGSASTCIATPVTAVQRSGMKGFSFFGTAQSSTPLPVELLSFDAVYNGKNVDVNWTTALEINNNYFEVEKSKDAENFSFLKKVITKATNGNSNYNINYTINDPEAISGIYYYRLKQFDINGSYKYSPVSSVEIGGENDENNFHVQPNPTSGTTEVSYRCYSSESVSLKVYDDRGRLLISKEMNCQKGQNTVSIDLKAHSDGMYLIVLSTSNTVYKTKVVKTGND